MRSIDREKNEIRQKFINLRRKDEQEKTETKIGMGSRKDFSVKLSWKKVNTWNEECGMKGEMIDLRTRCFVAIRELD